MARGGFRNLDSDLSRFMEPVAGLLLGEPNRSLSTKHELRFGNKGSLAVNLAHGIFYDHESGEGGGVLDLVVREMGLSGREAFEWLKESAGAETGAERCWDRSKWPKTTSRPQNKRLTLDPSWLLLWDRSRVIAPYDPAGCYLRARNCALPPVDGDLRWHVSLRHPSGWTGPALVALITDVQSCKSISLLRTWIDEAKPGSKAPIDHPRLLLGGHRKQGGCIRLCHDDAVNTGLAVGEGVETMLTAAHSFEPVWSLIDAHNLAALPVLSGIEALTVVVDHDPAGLTAFETIADRWHEAGCEVRRVLMPKPGADLNSWAASDADG